MVIITIKDNVWINVQKDILYSRRSGGEGKEKGLTKESWDMSLPFL